MFDIIYHVVLVGIVKSFALREERDKALAASKIKDDLIALNFNLAERALADAERYRHMRSNATFQDRRGPGLYWYLPRWNRIERWEKEHAAGVQSADTARSVR